MATDPVQQIRKAEGDRRYDLDLRSALERLAAATPSIDAPYLSVSLDWRPKGSQPYSRYGRQIFADQTERIISGYEPRTPAHDSLTADIERISRWLDEEVDPSAHGVFIVACNATGVFETLSLGIPLETHVAVGPTPGLTNLSRMVDDFAAFGVILADQIDAEISFFNQESRERGVDLLSSGYPRHQQQGGMSQGRFQRRADERVDAFARVIAEEMRKKFEREPVETVVLAGDEVITTALNNALHESIKERIVGIARVDIRATTEELLEAVLPMVADAERRYEEEAAQRVNDGQGPGGFAVAGAEDVLVALQSGQVQKLVINDDFHGPGWADFTLPLYGTGEAPTTHPAGGESANIVGVSLEDEIIRLAVQTGAEIEIVHSAVPVEPESDEPIRKADDEFPRSAAAQSLDKFGGVGAILRYTIGDEQSLAEA